MSVSLIFRVHSSILFRHYIFVCMYFCCLYVCLFLFPEFDYFWTYIALGCYFFFLFYTFRFAIKFLMWDLSNFLMYPLRALKSAFFVLHMFGYVVILFLLNYKILLNYFLIPFFYSVVSCSVSLNFYTFCSWYQALNHDGQIE